MLITIVITRGIINRERRFVFSGLYEFNNVHIKTPVPMIAIITKQLTINCIKNL